MLWADRAMGPTDPASATISTCPPLAVPGNHSSMAIPTGELNLGLLREWEGRKDSNHPHGLCIKLQSEVELGARHSDRTDAKLHLNHDARGPPPGSPLYLKSCQMAGVGALSSISGLNAPTRHCPPKGDPVTSACKGPPRNQGPRDTRKAVSPSCCPQKAGGAQVPRVWEGRERSWR